MLFEMWLGHPLIEADNVWGLLGVMCVSVALAIGLEQKYQWASRVSGSIIALILAMLMANVGIIPTQCPLYDDVVWGYVVPMGIPLLLLQCDIKRIWKEAGRMLTIFLIGAVGTVAGAFLAYYLLRAPFGDAQGLAKVAAMMTGSYIGGSVNFTALANAFHAGGLTASVQEDGSGARADVRLPAATVRESQSSGAAVVLPIPALPGNSASLTVHTGSVRLVRVDIPARGNEDTTVAYFVNGDGPETMIKTAVLSGGRITVSVPNGATVRLRDNGKDFYDTQGHWAEDAIGFVTARELFSGKTSAAFSPDTPMTRAMLMTVLARLDGADAAGGDEKGMAWAVARGVSDGRNPGGSVTREQFVAMLHRYAGSPAATERELRFSDAEAVSAYAREAARWAVENGIISGYGDNSFAPGGWATRAQAAAMLTRYVNYLKNQ